MAAVDPFRAYEISYQGLPATLGGGRRAHCGTVWQAAVSFGRAAGRRLRATAGTRQRHRQRAVREQARGACRETSLELPLGGRRGAVPRHRCLLRLFERARLHHHGPRHAAASTCPTRRLRTSPCTCARASDLEDGRRAVEAALAGRKVVIFTNRTLREEAIRDLRPHLRHHLCAGGGGGVRGGDGGGRGAAGAGDRPPARVRPAALSGAAPPGRSAA